MFLKSSKWACVAILLCSGFAMAQEDGDDGDRPRRVGGEGRRGERGRFAPPDFGRGGITPDTTDMMAEDVKLDETQKAQVDELIKSHQARVGELMQQMRQSPEDREKFQEIRDEMRLAREEQDMDRMRELAEEVTELRRQRDEQMAPIRKQIDDDRKKLHDDVLVLLREDQKEPFKAFWQEQVETPRGFDGPMRNPRMLKNMVERAPALTEQQRAQIDEIFKAFQEEKRAAEEKAKREGDQVGQGQGQDDEGDGRGFDRRGARRGERRVEDARLKKLYDDVLAVLTPDQRERIEMMLQGPGGDRPGRGERGERGRGRGRGGNRDRDDEPEDN